MTEDDRTARALEAAVHELAQQLQVLEMALAAIERHDGERHARVLEPARRALGKLDRGLEELEELAELVRRGQR